MIDQAELLEALALFNVSKTSSPVVYVPLAASQTLRNLLLYKLPAWMQNNSLIDRELVGLIGTLAVHKAIGLPDKQAAQIVENQLSGVAVRAQGYAVKTTGKKQTYKFRNKPNDRMSEPVVFTLKTQDEAGNIQIEVCGWATWDEVKPLLNPAGKLSALRLAPLLDAQILKPVLTLLTAKQIEEF